MEFAIKNKPLAWLTFVVMPVLLLIINSISIYKLAVISGDWKSRRFLKVIVFNLFVIISSIAVIIIFLIN